MRKVILAEPSKLRDAWVFKNHGGLLLPAVTDENESKDPLWKLSQSQHMCCIFETEEECLMLMRSFILGGILTNEKTLYLIERPDQIDITLNLLKDEVFIETEELEDGTEIMHRRSVFDFYERGQIVFLLHSESYTKGEVFDCDRSIRQIIEFRDTALKEGYRGSRVTGCPSFAHHMERVCPGTVDQLIEYESKLNYFFSQQKDCHAWCQYNKTNFSHSTLLSILTTHPTAVVSNEIYDNFYYIPPEELLDKGNIQHATLNNWISNLKTKKKMDSDLRASNIELMKVNHALTKEINKRRKVEREKDEAEALNRAKSQFMATISHEIRTPLTGILGTAALLMQASDLSKEHQESVSIIQTSGDHLLSVINDVLTFSKLESGKFSLDHIPFDMKLCVKNVIDMFRVVAKQREMTVDCNIESNVMIPRYIKGDPTRLRQVLFNLVSNAVKFTPNKGNVFIEINAIRTDETHSTIQFAVHDTGIGIAKEKFDFIFDSFSQIDSTMERQYEGTGLGLSISKKIVEAWSGNIWVTSEEGKGSNFFFTLPAEVVAELPLRPLLPKNEITDLRSSSVSLVTPPSTLKRQARRSTEAMRVERPAGKRKRKNLSIMVADDNIINKKVLCKMLECVGYPPDIVVSNGLEVVNEVEKRRQEKTKQIDVILLDLQMPTMNGLEASRIITRYSDWGNQRKPTIVCVTACVLLEDQEPWKEVGIDFHLPKPIKIELLENLLDKLADKLC
eukprot:TRINITY_DN1601_c0_g1_i1.p1 TRINITY_DN1601_c0_g1~~TRINITY_DN1601_c0_g1_i1.p1  ORF type:complete len:734 (+),score=187.93 TRINITY_DN1601_c0_g1_i1:175-2376(+)